MGHVETARALKLDGAIKAGKIFDAAFMQRIGEAFAWSVANPGPYSTQVYRGTKDQHFNDNSNPAATGMYKDLALAGPFADFLSRLWGSDHVWLFAEEIFSKEGGQAGRTPWHQDTSYLPWRGEHWANFWISLEAVPKVNSIEVVRGSHHGTRYDGSSYDDPSDPTKPLWGNGALPRLPDIEADRAKDPTSWDILSWETAVGDAIVFHPATLHGGAPVDPAFPDRHTLVLRFFGDDATFEPMPNGKPGGLFKKELAHLKSGDLFRSPAFAQLL